MEPDRKSRAPLCVHANAFAPDAGSLVRKLSVPLGPVAHVGRVDQMSLETRLAKVIGYAADRLPADAGAQLRSLIEPKAIAAMVLMFGIVAGAQLTPFGWVADLIAFLIALGALGSSAWEVAQDVRAFARVTAAAEHDGQLREAGAHLAKAVATIGVGALVLFLTKRAARLTVSTSQLLQVAKSVALSPRGRIIALWSGIDPLKLPANFATLELMLSETSAGRALLGQLKSRKFEMTQDVWFTLSDRVSLLASESKGTVHYFVAELRGYRKAMATGKEPRQWWINEGGKARLIKHIKSSRAKDGKPSPDIAERLAKLEFWTQEQIEAQYYAEHRASVRGGVRKFDDEIFHKLEKLGIDKVLVHELDAAGIEKGQPFWMEP